MNIVCQKCKKEKEHYATGLCRSCYSSKRNKISSSYRDSILVRDNFICRKCGIKGDKHNLILDHINSIANGGGNEPENLQILCKECNRQKTLNDNDFLRKKKGIKKKELKICIKCKKEKEHYANGFCRSCYSYERIKKKVIKKLEEK